MQLATEPDERLPFSVTSVDSSLDLPGSTQRADQIAASVTMPHGTGPGHSWFIPLAFKVVTEPTLRQRGIQLSAGTPSYNLDFRLCGNFAFSEPAVANAVPRRSVQPHQSTPFRFAGNNVSIWCSATWRGSPKSRRFPAITGVTNLAREGID